MNMLIEYLGSISAGTALGWLVAVVLGLNKIYSLIEKYRKVRNRQDYLESITEQNAQQIKVLKKETSKLQQSLISQVSRLDQKDVLVNEKLNHITEAIDELDRYQRAKDMNVLKDSINTKFRSYMARAKHNNGKVFLTQNEFQSFEGLIASYTAAGGNSFIHEDIQPATLKWQILSDEEVARRLGEK